ncbi:NAD(P)-dependent oxidoreductase [Nonomuraea glycinis]|uniref:2-hydroxy-3-oxopropionate reductase n=1 Tax=Nonomuraea glycinis TaxID=2047744 RepID=A0A917ZXQ8_9ACTN|nr:NAD(P)-dependent oxidoreductase [Nonomuraea glycinis]MCA2175218.1 NAD(P)-dependent oxidoreductase [Nonomuraea glycinis]GGP00536.1 2-hydroxy-3-oxopropionate reductase [Nonomuraea glycinis]
MIALQPGATVGFVGLGNMGLPMARRLLAAGYRVNAYDRAEAASEALVAAGGTAVATAAGVARGAVAVVLMLPDSAAVEAVMDGDGLLEAAEPGTVIIDMGSSRPLATRALAARTALRGVHLVDAPVSGGVKGAVNGTLTIMTGGEPDDVDRVRPLLEVVGKRVLHLGPAGAGHALKALNNLMSATHLLLTSEAMLVGQRFGLDPATMLEAVNGSSGRSGSTERKWPDHILPETYDSGFGLRLMLKDMRIGVELAEATGVTPRLGLAATDLWAEAADHLPPTADHTEIVKRLRQLLDER